MKNLLFLFLTTAFIISCDQEIDNLTTEEYSLVKTKVSSTIIKQNQLEDYKLDVTKSILSCDCTPVFLIEKFAEFPGDPCPNVRVTLVELTGENCTCEVEEWDLRVIRPGNSTEYTIGTFTFNVPNSIQEFTSGPTYLALGGPYNPHTNKGTAIQSAQTLAVGESISFKFEFAGELLTLRSNIILDCEGELECSDIAWIDTVWVDCF